MGGLVPVITTLSTAISAVDRFAGAVKEASSDPQAQARKDLQAQQALAMKQLKAQQQAKEDQAAADAALEKQKIAQDAQGAEETRMAALRRAVARQKASFGASGTGSSGGSAQAVLLGLFDESDAERAQREQLDSLRTTALDSDLAQERALNVLQRTQLQQKQALDRELLSA